MRFELPDGLKLVHEMRIPVRWGDLDAMGHVNNTIYFRYFESLRIEWLGLVGALPNPEGVGPVMANGFCNFIRQIEYPGEIVARHYVAAPRRARIRAAVSSTSPPWPACARCPRSGSTP